MDQDMREHRLSVARQVQQQVAGCSVLFEINVVAYLELYGRLTERKHDALTTGRLTSEMTRTRRSLGLDVPTGRSGVHGRQFGETGGRRQRQSFPIGGADDQEADDAA